MPAETQPVASAKGREPFELEVRGLVKCSGERRLLGGVDLAVRDGETIVVIGPSGGGKSTLLRCLDGLVPFDEGEVRVGAHRLVAGPLRANRLAAREIHRRVGMVFQDFQLFPHLTALENVALAPVEVLGMGKAEARERALELLSRMGLGRHVSAPPARLSGGEKQRVAFARALAMRPSLLLCDEVTSALDPELRQDVRMQLEELRQGGMALIVVTHDVGLAARIADRVVMLDEGRVVEAGPPAEVLEHPRADRTKTFLRRLGG